MAIVTSRQLTEYYNKYGKIDVTFTKEINDSLRVARNQIYLKFKDGQRPCILYSSSMMEAKIVVALNEDLIKKVKDDNLVSLRFCFYKEDRSDIFSFFVQGRITGLTLYNKENNLHFAQISFTHKPPDDMIEIMGSLLEANINAARRAEERIVVNNESLRRLGIASKNAVLLIDRIPRNGIIRDLSFGGIKIIIMGNPKFLIGKLAIINFSLSSGKSLNVVGEIVRFESVEGRKDLAALAIKYIPEKVPFEYKLLINEYLRYAGRKKAPKEAQ